MNDLMSEDPEVLWRNPLTMILVAQAYEKIMMQIAFIMDISPLLVNIRVTFRYDALESICHTVVQLWCVYVSLANLCGMAPVSVCPALPASIRSEFYNATRCIFNLVAEITARPSFPERARYAAQTGIILPIKRTARASEVFNTCVKEEQSRRQAVAMYLMKNPFPPAHAVNYNALADAFIEFSRKAACAIDFDKIDRLEIDRRTPFGSNGPSMWLRQGSSISFHSTFLCWRSMKVGDKDVMPYHMLGLQQAQFRFEVPGGINNDSRPGSSIFDNMMNGIFPVPPRG